MISWMLYTAVVGLCSVVAAWAAAFARGRVVSRHGRTQRSGQAGDDRYGQARVSLSPDESAPHVYVNLV